jgi:hypothetical protein
VLAFILYPALNTALASLAQALSSRPAAAPLVDGTLVDYLSVKAGLFPSHLGGPLWYAEKVLSFQSLVSGLAELEKNPFAREGTEIESCYQACELLKSMAEGSSSLSEELFFRVKEQKKSER